MQLVPGEYEFECDECHGDGSVQTVRATDGGEAELVWDRCDDCRGQGTVSVDEEEAAEAIKYGRTPLRTPSAT
jgi:DnaJ-class molecular chaperone